MDRIALRHGGASSLIFGVSIALRAYLFNTAGERVVTRLRERLYRRILDQEVAFFDARRTGELTSRLASDTGVRAERGQRQRLDGPAQPAPRPPAGWCCCSITSPLLTVLMLSVVPAVAMGAVIYGRRVRRLARDVQDALAAAGEIAEESIAGLRTVRSFDAEEKEAARYARRRGQGVRAGPQAHPRRQHLHGRRPRSPATSRRCWCSGTAAGCWPGAR